MNYPNNTIPEIPTDWTFYPPMQQHAYGAATHVPPERSGTLHEHKEKTCLKCGVTRLTIIGANNPRAWRLPGSDRLVWREPVCEAVQVAANVEGAAA